MMDDFSEELIRRRGSLTQAEAGRLLGVTWSAVGQMERSPPKSLRARLRLRQRYDDAGLVLKD